MAGQPHVSGMITRRTALIALPVAMLSAAVTGTAAYMATQDEPAVPIGGPFSLLDGDGKTITDRAFRGRVMMVYFGYTHCPDACPTALADMVAAADILGDRARDLALVFITVDPERDTPAVMKDYVSPFGLPIVALSGSSDAVAAAARTYRVYAVKHPTADGYDMDHSSIIYVMDRAGRFLTNFTHETPPAQIADRLRTVL